MNSAEAPLFLNTSALGMRDDLFHKLQGIILGDIIRGFFDYAQNDRREWGQSPQSA